MFRASTCGPSVRRPAGEAQPFALSHHPERKEFDGDAHLSIDTNSIGLRNQRVPIPGGWLLNDVKCLPKPCGRGGITMLRVVRYLAILLLDVVLATHNPRRIRFACTNEPTPRPATARNCRVWSHRKRTCSLLLAAQDSQCESMLEEVIKSK